MAQQEQSDLGQVQNTNFWGLDAQRDPAEGNEYGVGVMSINQGRNLRRPLEVRVGLTPQTSSNGNHLLGGRLFALGAMPQGERLVLLARMDQGRVISIQDVEVATT